MNIEIHLLALYTACKGTSFYRHISYHKNGSINIYIIIIIIHSQSMRPYLSGCVRAEHCVDYNE